MSWFSELMSYILEFISIAQMFSVNILTICLENMPKEGSMSLLVLFRYIWLLCSNFLTYKISAQKSELKLSEISPRLTVKRK